MEPDEMFARIAYYLGMANEALQEGNKAQALAFLCICYCSNRLLIEAVYKTLDFEQLGQLFDIELES